MLRLGILGSTRGTDMLALISAIKTNRLNATINLVASNKHDAIILQRAKEYHLKTLYLDPKQTDYHQKLSSAFKNANINMIILIGYMKILPTSFINDWQNKIINVHPSLLPAFAGGINNNVHEAVLNAGVKETGCTVHLVTEQIDAGPILLQKKMCRPTQRYSRNIKTTRTNT